MKYVWIEESPNTASDCSVATTEKRRRPQIAVWYHQKGRRTLPKARAGIGVEKKWSELRRKDCLEGRRRQKSPKEVRAGLGWENQGGGKADRRQAKLEEEARRRKSSHAPPRAAREIQPPPENCAWPARGCSFGAGAFTKVEDLLQALLLVILTTLLKVYVRGGLFEKSRELLAELEDLGYAEDEVQPMQFLFYLCRN
ncbi:hypothetical protein CK203_100913 [Vitis vinifera]|uniref:Uncharacterized protein n=1 Tax=Vitis vinifera TaxID=29760 RepID=A0A438E6X8_VITVI|nr:hypothetical protein CK203_100913 [Vitis vinifera]